MSSAENKAIRIFLAHAQEDKQQVLELYDRLKRQGYQPWLDKKDLLPGQRWREEIPRAIRESDIFIACLSKNSVAKQGYVQREFRMALNACADRPPGTIYLIPLRFDDCQIPELRQEEYGISLLDYQWLDYFEADGFDRLVQSIETYFPGQITLSQSPPLNMPVATVQTINEKHRNLLRLIHDIDQQNPTFGGVIAVTQVIAPHLQGYFDLGELGTAIKALDRDGYLKIRGSNALGQVEMTELGRREVE